MNIMTIFILKFKNKLFTNSPYPDNKLNTTIINKDIEKLGIYDKIYNNKAILYQ